MSFIEFGILLLVHDTLGDGEGEAFFMDVVNSFRIREVLPLKEEMVSENLVCIFVLLEKKKCF